MKVQFDNIIKNHIKVSEDILVGKEIHQEELKMIICQTLEWVEFGAEYWIEHLITLIEGSMEWVLLEEYAGTN